ncbi:MAG: hypothetical protein R6V77_02930, partial [Candidatus Cloacimonadaceae bacterium]
FGTDTEIHDNLFRNISYTGTNPYQAMGIEVYLGGYNKIYNNMISKISNPNSTMTPQVIAINIDTSFPNDISNNSIFLNAEGPLSNPDFITAGVNFARDFNITMTNNIIVNLSNALGGGLSCVLYSYNSSMSGLAAGTDNNIYYCGTPGASHVIASFQGIEYQTIDDYKNATGTIEQNSLTELVPFVSTGSLPDLHIRTYMPTVVEGNGIPIAWVTEDFDGNPRHATNPDIGADEGNFLTTTPDTPQNVLIDGSDGVFTIYWDLVQGATIYKIYRAVDPYASLPWQLIGTVQNPNHYHVFEDYDPKAFYFVTAQY